MFPDFNKLIAEQLKAAKDTVTELQKIRELLQKLLDEKDEQK